MSKILKVGFDLDGVILYNPIRIFRPLAKKFLKPIKVSLLHQDKESFYFPYSPFEQWLWKILHKTSFRINTGFGDIKKLSKDKKIKMYLVTGRYSFLKQDYLDWLEKIGAKKIFTRCYYNKTDQQPNEFKENMITKLKLDIYVEDNWDIVEKLNIKYQRSKIFWMTNILDKNIPYQFKFFSLQEVCQYLKKLV